MERIAHARPRDNLGRALPRQFKQGRYADAMSATRVHRVHPRRLADYLLERGERFVTTDRCAELLRVKPENVSRSLASARHANQMVSVTNRAWVPVPLNRRKKGAPPLLDYLDSLMAHLGQPYYLGYRAAAAVYGASHHSFAHYHIVTPAPHRNRRIGMALLCFVRGEPNQKPTVHKSVGYGGNADIVVSTPEATAFDLVQRPILSGGIDYVATLIGDMIVVKKLSVGALCDVSQLYPLSISQRLGYIIEIMQGHLSWAIRSPLDMEPLAQMVAKRKARTVSLMHPSLSGQTEIRSTPLTRRWRLKIDHVLEPDQKSRGQIVA